MDYVEQDFECEYVGWILKYINNDKYIDVCEYQVKLIHGFWQAKK